MKMNNLIIAGIVSYNPDIDLLKKNIEALIKVNLNIIIVDNHSSNIMEIREATKSEENILIYELESNRGIANALNSIMNYAFDHNIKWVLTLDQDSIVPCNIIQDNLKCLKESNNIGIISPVILDRNIQNKSLELSVTTYSEISTCITSASLTSVHIWKEVGGFDEIMFIDDVDHEYCFRIRKAGYKIIRNNNVFLSHAIGETNEIKIGKKHILVRNHSAFRKYYQARNSIYMDIKCYKKITMHATKKIFKLYFKTVFFEKKRLEKIKAINRGVIDGFKLVKRI